MPTYANYFPKGGARQPRIRYDAGDPKYEALEELRRVFGQCSMNEVYLRALLIGAPYVLAEARAGGDLPPASAPVPARDATRSPYLPRSHMDTNAGSHLAPAPAPVEPVHALASHTASALQESTVENPLPDEPALVVDPVNSEPPKSDPPAMTTLPPMAPPRIVRSGKAAAAAAFKQFG